MEQPIVELTPARLANFVCVPNVDFHVLRGRQRKHPVILMDARDGAIKIYRASPNPAGDSHAGLTLVSDSGQRHIAMTLQWPRPREGAILTLRIDDTGAHFEMRPAGDPDGLMDAGDVPQASFDSEWNIHALRPMTYRFSPAKIHLPTDEEMSEFAKLRAAGNQ